MAKKLRLPNGFGTITTLPGRRRKKYGARVTIGYDGEGRQIRKYIGYYEKYSDALTALSEYNSSPYDVDLSKFTLKEAFEKYKEWKYPEMSQSSINGYNAAYDKAGMYHNKPLINITTEDLQRLLDDEDIGHGIKRKIIVLFNQLFMYYSEDIPQLKKITTKAKLRKTKADMKAEEKVFTRDEIKMLWDNVNNYEDIDITLILLYTGFRINELLNILTDDVNLEERYLKGGNKTKASIDRIVPIHDKIFDFIMNRYDKNEKYLFRNRLGDHFKYSNFKRERFERLMDDLKMNHTPHDTRHTVATNLHIRGADKIAIRQILGHASKDITEEVYTHADIENLHKNITLLDY